MNHRALVSLIFPQNTVLWVHVWALVDTRRMRRQTCAESFSLEALRIIYQKIRANLERNFVDVDFTLDVALLSRVPGSAAGQIICHKFT